MKHLLWILVILAAFVAGCKKDDSPTLATLTTSAATNITSNTAQVGGNITSNGGASIIKSGVCFAVHSSPTVSDSITTDGSFSGMFTSSLNNLVANSTYYVRAYAINQAGTAYGDEISFVTAKGLATLTTTAISNIVPLSAKSGGNITSDGGSPITARGICWSTSAHPTITSSKTSQDGGIGSFVDSLAPLASQATYYVRAYATNSYGTAYGNELSFTASSAQTITDIDGNVYAYVTVGNQTWMGSNLRTSHYRNGDPITNGFTTTNFDWYGNVLASSSLIGAFTYANGDSSNDLKYGKLYNNAAVNDSRGMCPLGWHVPTLDDFDALELYLGMNPADTGINPQGVNLPAMTAAITKLIVGGSSGLNFKYAGKWLFPQSQTSTWQFFGFETSSGTKVANFWLLNSFLNTTEIWNYYATLESNFPYLTINPVGFNALPVRCIKD